MYPLLALDTDPSFKSTVQGVNRIFLFAAYRSRTNAHSAEEMRTQTETASSSFKNTAQSCLPRFTLNMFATSAVALLGCSSATHRLGVWCSVIRQARGRKSKALPRLMLAYYTEESNPRLVAPTLANSVSFHYTGIGNMPCLRCNTLLPPPPRHRSGPKAKRTEQELELNRGCCPPTLVS